MAGEAIPEEMSRLEKAARRRGEQMFPELAAPSIILGLVAASAAVTIFGFVGAIDRNGGGNYAGRAYLVAIVAGVIVFAWARNAERRRGVVIDVFVREEMSAAVARLALPLGVDATEFADQAKERRTIH